MDSSITRAMEMAHLVERTVGFEAGWTKRGLSIRCWLPIECWGSGRDYVTVRSRIRGTIKSRFGAGLGQDFGICRTAIFCMLMSFLMNGSLGLKL